MKRVLIVDDARFMRFSLRGMLEKNGFQVVGEAANGVEAIEKYLECQPDLVTMDITMPGVSGIEALKAIKVLDLQAKVVIISALGQESFVREAVVYGAKSFIVKPFKEKQVIKTLNQVLAMCG